MSQLLFRRYLKDLSDLRRVSARPRDPGQVKVFVAFCFAIRYISLMEVRQMNIVTVPMLMADQEPVLAGRLDGKRAFVRSLDGLPSLNEPTVVVLDFRRVELATSSFLSEAVLPLRDHLRFRRPPAYVVVANLSEKVREELEELLNRASDALLGCELSQDGTISHAGLIGSLDPKLRETFELVRSKGETTAVQLHSESQKGDGIGPTAWNNRLTALATKSLLMEIPQGRAKKYRPVLEMA